VKLVAEPEPIELDMEKTAVIVVDMQNAFVSKGGMFDLMGYDVSPNQEVIGPIKETCTAARQKGVKVVYIAHVLSPDLHEVGPGSSFWYKEPLKTYRENPSWGDKILFRGTWGAEIVEALKPQEDDIFVEKPRFSAFFASNLDVILKTYDIKNLLFTGVATNICVESSIRDAAHLGYFPILVSDGAMNAGPPFTQDAAVFNVMTVFGWVTNTESVLEILK
jgi:ureidoacrylate peracid hydrolase